MKKLLKRTFILVMVLLPLITFAHFMVFPQETRCIFISFSSLDHRNNVYYNKGTATEQLEKLLALQTAAEKKFKLFWVQKTVPDYKMIYCDSEQAYNKYGSPGTPACTHRKLGAYVVLSNEGLDEQILAHELSHTILYTRIGWYKTTYNIPTWFEEGLAMQVDDRDIYSIDNLAVDIIDGTVLPSLQHIANPAQFYGGNSQAVKNNFIKAKYAVHEWLKTHSLDLFIEKIKMGLPFEVAFETALIQ